MTSDPWTPTVACISLEPWDRTWRRNQHLASRLVEQGHMSQLVFVEPPVLGQRGARGTPRPGVLTIRPSLLLPKRAGGLRLAAALLRRGPLRNVTVLWVNDPQLGVHCLRPEVPTVYDVTDDWRAFPQPPHIVRRIVAAEDELARRASTTVVCSRVLAERWRDRYGIQAVVIPNAVDLDAFARAEPVVPVGSGPHFGYVGTLHAARLDVPLVLSLADATTGTVHLVGPDALDDASRSGLTAHPRIVVHGPVSASAVPGWMRAMDVLLCPHLVNAFTLSLDAIKAYEYVAAARPVAATPTSGFQLLDTPGVKVVDRSQFVSAALQHVGTAVPRRDVTGWDERARQFADALLCA